MDLEKLKNWTPKARSSVCTIEAHTGGEPLRIFVAGHPELKQATVLGNRQTMKQHHDDFRKLTMWEPRGHADMYGCIIVPAENPTSDFGVIFLHNEGYSTMCGHAIIAITKVVMETGLVEQAGDVTELRIDTPAGTVISSYCRATDSVAFENVESFVVALDETVVVPGIGQLSYDLAFGGAFYAYVDVSEVGCGCAAEDFSRLVELGKKIKQAILESREIVHPSEPELGFLYGVIFVGPAEDPANHSRNVCVFADGQIDRSPTGTGVSGRAAIHFARKQIAMGEKIIIESIIGSSFEVSVKKVGQAGHFKSILPIVTGRAFITGKSNFFVDPADPLQMGFLLR